MLDTINEATSQPEQVAQTSDAKKGAGNVEESAFAKSLAAKQLARMVESAPAEQKPTAETPSAEPATEATQEAPTEAKADETKEEAEKSETPEESKEEADEVLSPETNSLDPKLQDKINRRIGKEVAKTKREIAARVAAETELATLKAQLAEKQDAPKEEVVVPVPANVPLADIDTPAKLEQLKHTAKTEMRWAESWLDEDIPPEGIMTDRGLATKKDLKTLIRNARIVQEDLIPQREKFLTSKSEAQTKAFEKFEYLKDPKHPGYQLAQQAKRENAAWLNMLPNADYIVGVYVKGVMAMQAEEAAKASTPKPTPSKIKPRPTGGQAEVASDSSASRVPVGTLKQQALDNELNKLKAKGGVSAKDFAAHLASNQLIRLTR